MGRCEWGSAAVVEARVDGWEKTKYVVCGSSDQGFGLTIGGGKVVLAQVQ